MRLVAVQKYEKINVAGVAFKNANGSSRQRIIQGLERGMKVRLLREPANEHDANAIAVLVAGQQIGYIPAEWAASLAPILDDEQSELRGEIADVWLLKSEDEPDGVWMTAVSLTRHEHRETLGFAALIAPVIARLKTGVKSAAAVADKQLGRFAGNDATFHWILRAIAVALTIVVVVVLLTLIF